MKRLPIGIEDFEKIRQEDYYYVDKTGMIGDIIRNGAEVTLFTRPRRFGKTLLMDMFADFFRLNFLNPSDTTFQQNALQIKKS